MSIRQIPSKIELGFWQIAINLLTDSKPVQQMVCWFYLEIGPKSRQYIKQLDRQHLLRWSAAGLGMGLLVGFLIALF